VLWSAVRAAPVLARKHLLSDRVIVRLSVSDTATAAWRQPRDNLERESRELKTELDSLKKPQQPR
jgi:hypothetical protein